MNYPLIFILLDGASENINDKTSLEIASTRNISKIIKKSKTGITYSIEKGIAPESDAAALSLLGYNPKEIKVSRGILEALGVGINLNEGDLALRVNFATAKNDLVIDRRVGRKLNDYEAKILVKEVKENLKFPENFSYELIHTIGHRAVLVIRKKDKPLGSNISNLDPAYIKIGDIVHAVSKINKKIKLCEAFDEESKKSAELVNFFFLNSRKILEESKINKQRKIKGLFPANIFLLRDAGSKIPKVKKFNEKYGLKGVCIADMPVEIGVARLLGMDFIKTKYKRDPENYKEKAIIVSKLIEKFNFIYVHLKGPDEPSHDGDKKMKIKIIEEIDNYFFKNLLELVNLNKVSILITCDHSTIPKFKSHTDDPVPFAFYYPNIKADNVNKFTEKECSKGSFGLIKCGYSLLNKILNLLK